MALGGVAAVSAMMAGGERACRRPVQRREDCRGANRVKKRGDEPKGEGEPPGEPGVLVLATAPGGQPSAHHPLLNEGETSIWLFGYLPGRGPVHAGLAWAPTRTNRWRWILVLHTRVQIFPSRKLPGDTVILLAL